MLIQTLPDKGKKIKEFVDKVHLAIEDLDEEERRQSLASAARTELQSKYQQAFTKQQHAIPNPPAAFDQNEQSADAAGREVQESKNSSASSSGQKKNALDQNQFVSRLASDETMETAAAGASLNFDQTEDGDLVEAMDKVRLSETSNKSRDPLNSISRDNYFLKKETNKSYFVTVLDKTAPRKQKFKPNQWVDLL